jgi:hypothetical protein
MAFTTTLETFTGQSGVTETAVVVESTSGTNTSVSVAIDFSDYYDRIATAMETIATNSTTIATKITNIEDHLNTAGTAANLASKITTLSEELTTIDDNVLTIANEITTIDDNVLSLATDIARIRDLGDYTGSGDATAQGFKTRDDNTIQGKIGSATLWKLYVEDGEILVDDSVVSEAEQTQAVNKLNSLIATVQANF